MNEINEQDCVCIVFGSRLLSALLESVDARRRIAQRQLNKYNTTPSFLKHIFKWCTDPPHVPKWFVPLTLAGGEKAPSIKPSGPDQIGRLPV